MARCQHDTEGCKRCEAPLSFDFTMAFQPIVDIATASVYGYEALVRGVQGESAATILAQVDQRVLYRFDQQCRVKAIQQAHGLAMRDMLSINFLPNAVYDPNACIQTTLRVANELDWSPRQICFEITETEFVADRAHLQAIVDIYRDYGFRVALDDFGTGYANLELLVDLSPDILKIDRRFVSDVPTDRRRQAVILGIAAMADTLSMEVVAEGVETLAEARWLYQAGITRHQGFFYARPAIDHLGRPDPARLSEVQTG